MGDDASALVRIEERLRWSLRHFIRSGTRTILSSPHASLPDFARLPAVPDPLGNQHEEQRTHHHQDGECDHHRQATGVTQLAEEINGKRLLQFR